MKYLMVLSVLVIGFSFVFDMSGESKLDKYEKEGRERAEAQRVLIASQYHVSVSSLKGEGGHYFPPDSDVLTLPGYEIVRQSQTYDGEPKLYLEDFWGLTKAEEAEFQRTLKIPASVMKKHNIRKAKIEADIAEYMAKAGERR